jgi:hypothetical protein
MAAGFLEIEMGGDFGQVNRMLDYLAGVLSPIGMAAFMATSVGPWLRSRAQDRFFEEGDSAVGKWAPLAQATQEVRARLQVGASGPINRRTGELENYITQSNWIITVNPLGVTLQYPSNPPRSQGLQEKMRTAQEGRLTPSTVPRPVLGMDEADLAYVLTSLAFLIEAGARAL